MQQHAYKLDAYHKVHLQITTASSSKNNYNNLTHVILNNTKKLLHTKSMLDGKEVTNLITTGGGGLVSVP